MAEGTSGKQFLILEERLTRRNSSFLPLVVTEGRNQHGGHPGSRRR